MKSLVAFSLMALVTMLLLQIWSSTPVVFQEEGTAVGCQFDGSDPLPISDTSCQKILGTTHEVVQVSPNWRP